MSNGEIVKLKQSPIDMDVVGGVWGLWHESAIKINDVGRVS